MGKDKKDKKDKNEEVEKVAEVESDDDYDSKLEFVNGIATPMANKKLVKRLYKCIKKGKQNIHKIDNVNMGYMRYVLIELWRLITLKLIVY